jgi:hypothetical protein
MLPSVYLMTVYTILFHGFLQKTWSKLQDSTVQDSAYKYSEVLLAAS